MEKQKLVGSETLRANDLAIDQSSVLDFWQWAFSDLQANNLRGIFAEWMVAKLTGGSLEGVRDSWREYDLEVEGDLKVEVKAAGYLQSWKQDAPSKIIFTSLKNRIYNYDTREYTENETYNADVYVFCLQHQIDPLAWDALNLENWTFFVLPRHALESLNVKSLSLPSLEKITAPIHARDLRNSVQSCSPGKSGGSEVPPR